MSWDPAVLRKYNTTGHFRLLNQVRSELKANPLVRPQDGQTVGDANRSKALLRATEGRGAGPRRGATRRGSSPQAKEAISIESSDAFTHGPFTVVPLLSTSDDDALQSAGFRERLNAVELR